MICRNKVHYFNLKLSLVLCHCSQALKSIVVVFALFLSLQQFFIRPRLALTRAHVESCPVFEDSAECILRQQEMDQFGVVVVGIGRAGGAHVRNLQNLPKDYPTLLRLKLVGYVSRYGKKTSFYNFENFNNNTKPTQLILLLGENCWCLVLR